MTIASALENLNTDIINARTAITTKGGTVTVNGGSSQLATDIATIPTGGSATLITKSITANGTYNASSDSADGYSSVNVNVSGGASSKYGATIDSILGYVDANGVLQFPTAQTDLVFTGVKKVESFALQYKFYRCYGVATVSFPDLTSLNHPGTVAGYEFYYAFTDCNLTSIDFPVLATVGSQRAFQRAFAGSTLPTATFTSLATISGQYAFQNAFSDCTSLITLYFPALTSTAFGSYTNQFNNMLSGVTGCTVHFPSNLQSVIGSWSSVTAGFGGTNTTVLFDLPATT